MSFINSVFGSLQLSLLVFCSIILLCSIGIYFYRIIAVHKGIVANPNFRSLHENPIPRGGGIVFSAIFVFCIFVLWEYDVLAYELLMIIGVGGLGTALFGFFDDIYNIRASRKLIMQIIFSVWAVYWINKYSILPSENFLFFITMPVTIIFLVWTINAYNFIDGIDGMAISGAFYICASLTLIMLLTDGKSDLAIIFFLLMASVSAFIFFNWPPASILMGDSGSIFLGYLFGTFIIITFIQNEISLWTWVVIFSYFFADTTVTLLARLILVKKWYGAHRSHAYQNLARIMNSHLKVTFGVVVYHIIWSLPLALWTIFQPEMAPLAAIVSVFPAFILVYRYGPVLSSS
jgi:Fuc2NAc and GlcNAc transferase